MTSLTKKPGEFRATCRKGAYLPVDQLTLEERAWAEAEDAARIERGEYGNVFKYDHRLKVETALVECTLDTTDRAELVAHMKRMHGGGLHRWDNGSVDPQVREVRNYSPRMQLPVKLWKPTRLTEDGKPWPATHDRTKTCDDCGLVAEVDGTNASDLWWREHQEFCAERQAASEVMAS